MDEITRPRILDRVSRWRPALNWLTGAAVLGAAAVLYRFDPSANTFFPRCYFFALTGFYCPGCGATRATHQLMHGHFAAAAHLNLFFVLCLPLVVTWSMRYVFLQWRGKPARFEIPDRWISFFLVLAAAFGFVRNLPGFEWLAPY